MSKKPNAAAGKPKVVQAPTKHVLVGKHGQRFGEPRAPKAFTTDPTGFMTEKDPRGKADNKWFDLPPATGIPPFRLNLGSILPQDAISRIVKNKRLVFHSVGDTGGVNTTTYQQHVESYMELDFNDNDTNGSNPSFMYHLGDVVYYDGEIANYFWEFYEPYQHYQAPIFAIPGNHDGDVDPNDQNNKPSDSLKGFVRNFCSQAAVGLPEAKDSARQAMTQPNVYWTLNTPMVTIIGLYTNVPEGGHIGLDQRTWFEGELAAAAKNLPLILALHHPLYSAYGPHPGSLYMKSVVEEASKAAGRIPDLILSGHVHDYQRFNGNINGKTVPCIVNGASGYNQKLHSLSRKLFNPDGCPYKMPDGPETLEKFNDTQHGYMKIEVVPGKINCQYLAVDDPTPKTVIPTDPAKAYDTFSIRY